MILVSLFATPRPAFKPVTFINGINYVYGFREDVVRTGEQRDSINNIGKSTFLDILDFILGADFSATSSPRLWVPWELGKLKGITVHLVFKVQDSEYHISRCFDKPLIINYIYPGHLEEKPLPVFRVEMGSLIFGRSDYLGVFDPEWYRDLLAFYIHILLPGRKEYPDPIKYIDFRGHATLMRLHLYLLNINNETFDEMSNLLSEQASLRKALKHVKNNISRLSGDSSIEKVETSIKKANSEIYELREQLAEYRLNKNQSVTSEDAALLSKQINDLTYIIFQAKQKLSTYNDSIKNPVSLSEKKMEELYNEIQTEFGTQIKHKLEDAILFRKRLVRARRYFFKNEIERLKKVVYDNELEITRLDEKRSEIFRILSSASALTNLKDAYGRIDEKQRFVSELEGQMKITEDFTQRLSALNKQIEELESRYIMFRRSLTTEETVIRSIYEKFFTRLCKMPSDVVSFYFDIAQKNGHSKFDIKVFDHPGKLGKSRNRIRVLLYNLTVLVYSIQKSFNAPRFIIHDAVMDSVDKANYNDLINMLHEPPFTGLQFQYIIALNEEGILTEKFGQIEHSSHENIKKVARVKLTPDEPLLGHY